MVCSRTWSEEPREWSLVVFFFLLRKAIEGIKGKLMFLLCFQLPVSMAKNWNAEHCYDSMLIVFLHFQIPFNFSLVFRFCFFFLFFCQAQLKQYSHTLTPPSTCTTHRIWNISTERQAYNVCSYKLTRQREVPQGLPSETHINHHCR